MVTLNIPNNNQKLSCNVFIHIALAPKRKVLESELPIRYEVKNGDETFQVDMVDFLRFKLKEIPSVLTYVSHGVSSSEFLSERMAMDPETEYAAFIYKKVTDA